MRCSPNAKLKYVKRHGSPKQIADLQWKVNQGKELRAKHIRLKVRASWHCRRSTYKELQDDGVLKNIERWLPRFVKDVQPWLTAISGYKHERPTRTAARSLVQGKILQPA